MEKTEMDEIIAFIDLKITPLNVKIEGIENRLQRFATAAYFVCGVILVPLLFFILDKVF